MIRRSTLMPLVCQWSDFESFSFSTCKNTEMNARKNSMYNEFSRFVVTRLDSNPTNINRFQNPHFSALDA